jgi:hypothetical protein
MAAEVSTQQAAQILSTTPKTIWEKCRDGKIKARRQGERGVIRIDIDELRRYAQAFGYRFNEDLAEEFTAE